MDVTIREMGFEDRAIWSDMRFGLWPDTTPADHLQDIATLLADPEQWAFIVTANGNIPAGFVEIAIRKYANGCTERPVAFLEGLWVAPAFRRQGIGARLIAHAEHFLRAKGFREFCSDALLDNADSHAAHAGWGFAETERVIYFRKAL